MSSGQDESDGLAVAWRRFAPPVNEMPVAVAFTAVLGRSGDVAVAICGLRAYSTGIEFDLVVRLRTAPTSSAQRSVFDQINGQREPGDPVDDVLLLGFEYPDGSTVANVSSGRGRPTAAPAGARDTQPSLMSRGGGGGDREYSQSWWLTPLPPTGPLRVVFRWSAMDLPETTVELDGAALAAAGHEVEVLWPLEPDPVQPDPETPQAPHSGWFATAARAPDLTGPSGSDA